MRKFAIYLVLLSSLISGWQLFSVAGYGMKITDFAIIIILLIFFKQLIFDSKKFDLQKNPVFFLLIVQVTLITISGLYPFFVGDGKMIFQFFKSSIHFYYYVIFALIFFLDPPETKTINHYVRIYLILFIFINIFGAYQLFARVYGLPFAFIEFTNISLIAHGLEGGADDTVAQLSLSFENFYRATSIFTEPSALAGFNIVNLIYLLIPRILRIEPFIKNRALSNTMFICSIIGLFLTFSLSGLFNIALILAILLFLYWRQTYKYVIPTILIGAVIIGVSDMLVNKYFEISVVKLFVDRITAIISFGQGTELMAGESFLKRFDTIIQSFEIWLKSPVIGVGLGQTSAFVNETGYLFFDSSFAALLAETGIFSLLTYFVLASYCSYRAMKHLRDKALLSLADDNLKRLIAIQFFLILTLFVNSFITTNAVISENFWMSFGFFLAIEHHIGKIKKDLFYKVQLTNIEYK